MSVAFSAFTIPIVAFIIAFTLTILKVFYSQQPYYHNFSELFLYGGLAVIFIPVFSILSISLLLILIAIYDAIAVWKTKHMVVLARQQAKTHLFAGLSFSYGDHKTAILGGGDIGFPLLYTGVLFVTYGWLALIVTLTTTLSLYGLLRYGKKNTFYPAMPFIAAGCFLGYGFLVLF